MRRNTGAAASQGATNPYLAHRGLEALGNGLSANEALEWLLKGDEQRNARQIQLVDAQGRSSAWTGECNGFAGHLCGENFSVAGNWLENAAVLQAMAETFQGSDPSWKIGRRVLSVAAEAAGGDRRSPMASSAALQVVANWISRCWICAWISTPQPSVSCNTSMNTASRTGCSLA